MKRTILDINKSDLENKRVLVRVDFNVPQKEDGSISDDARIRAAIPTIEYLAKCNAKVILVSHLGRPKGISPMLSNKLVAERLGKLINQSILFVDTCSGATAEQAINSLQAGQVCLLENVRFHQEEERNDPQFAQKLAKLADIYVNDAFGTAHRAHASTEGIARFVQPALAGLLMAKEIESLSTVLSNPERPFMTIIGGSKVSTKIKVLENLVAKVDILVIGGAMAFTFLKSRGFEVGKSLVELNELDFCQKLEKLATNNGVELILPVDVIVADEIKLGANSQMVTVANIPADKMGLDVGPRTSQLIDDAIAKSKTILWNGPLGVFEVKGFEVGTQRLAKNLVTATSVGVKTIVGGGDSVAAIQAFDIPPESFYHVSTGGGATLEFLEGIDLPGVACLEDKATSTCNI